MATKEIFFVLCMISTTLLHAIGGQSSHVRQARRNQPIISPYVEGNNVNYNDQAQYLAGAYQNQGKYTTANNPVLHAQPILTHGRNTNPKQGDYQIPAKPATPVYRPQSNEPKNELAYRPEASNRPLPSGYKNVANIVFADIPEEGFDADDYEYATYHGHPEAQGFGYAVDDNDNGSKFTHNGYSEGNTTKGEYRVLLPDGRTQVVTYSSNPESGYMARVSYEGTARPHVPANVEEYASPHKRS
ncbi:uncharacterized protein LOC122263121 [Penaeus japonicus]|uniref:uncharacterized protein LOC122263121 n=1 Tax=Penaeus japonicus TaxID=27405 RepID=UPI001C717796|nr:uncharacterized protein LOC122263121 [Penaeus japonicus]